MGWFIIEGADRGAPSRVLGEGHLGALGGDLGDGEQDRNAARRHRDGGRKNAAAPGRGAREHGSGVHVPALGSVGISLDRR